MKRDNSKPWIVSMVSIVFLIVAAWMAWPDESTPTPRTNDPDPKNELKLPARGVLNPADVEEPGDSVESESEAETDAGEAGIHIEEGVEKKPEPPALEEGYEYFTATISGRVTDSFGALVPHAKIWIVDDPFERFPSERTDEDGHPVRPGPGFFRPREVTEADDSGFYEFKLTLKVESGVERLSLNLHASPPEEHYRKSDVVRLDSLHAGDEKPGVDFVVPVYGGISGRVVDTGGRGVPGVGISLKRLPHGPSGVVNTISSGRFEHGRLAPGRYRIRIASLEYELAKGPGEITLSPGEDLVLQEPIVVAQRTVVRIELSCEGLEPWDKRTFDTLIASIYLRDSSGEVTRDDRPVDKDGRITLIEFPEDLADVRVEVPGFKKTDWYVVIVEPNQVNRVPFDLQPE